MLESFSVIVVGAMLIALVAAIFVGIVIGFFAFVIMPILALIGTIMEWIHPGWLQPDKKEEPVEENL